MRVRLISSLCLAFFAGAVAPAAAQDSIDRVQVGVPGTVTKNFSSSLGLRLTIPSGYARDCCYDFVSGAWVGPAVRYSGDPSRQSQARTEWSVSFKRTSQSLAKVAKSAGWTIYPTVSAHKRKVRHVLAGGNLGNLKAYSTIEQQFSPSAKAQGTLVIDLGQKVKAIALFTLLDPSVDSASSGSLTVNGLSASAYNRKAAESMLKSVAIEGSLPISRVKARAIGGRIAGKVTDIAGQAVGQATVTLERRAGKKWKTVRKGKSTLKGTFSLPATGKGKYRVFAKMAGASARSKPVRVP
jgi:hypothetical protein